MSNLNLTQLKYRPLHSQLDTLNVPADVTFTDVFAAPLDADCTLLQLQADMYPADSGLGFTLTTIQN